MTARVGTMPKRFTARRTSFGLGLPFFDVLPADDYIDQVVDIKHRAVVPQYGVCAIGRNRDLASLALDGFQQIADAREGSTDFRYLAWKFLPCTSKALFLTLLSIFGARIFSMSSPSMPE
jgi:hypothetical protein